MKCVETKTLFWLERFWVIKILIVDWRGHNHNPKRFCLTQNLQSEKCLSFDIKNKYTTEKRFHKIWSQVGIHICAFKWGVINTCWIFQIAGFASHTSYHLCLPSCDWPIFLIRNFVNLCCPFRRRTTGMIRRVGANPAIWKIQQDLITPHLNAPMCTVDRMKPIWLFLKVFFEPKKKPNRFSDIPLIWKKWNLDCFRTTCT